MFICLFCIYISNKRKSCLENICKLYRHPRCGSGCCVRHCLINCYTDGRKLCLDPLMPKLGILKGGKT